MADGRLLSSITVSDEIKSAFTNAFSNEKRKDGKAKFIIFKINDTMDDLLIDEISQDPDYEVFRNKLESARDSKGKPVPRYGVYDAEYELPGEGHRYDMLNDILLLERQCELTSPLFLNLQIRTGLHLLVPGI